MSSETSTEQTNSPDAPAQNPDTPAVPTFWNYVGFWFPHIVAVGYAFVILAAIGTQFFGDELPCPLCVLQRMAMMLIGIGAIWVIGQAHKGTLTLSAYARSFGLMIVGALLGATMSVRQIELHILPGDPGYGEAVFGLHLYTWALITFIVVILYSAIMMMFFGATFPVVPEGKAALWTSRILVWLFIAIIIANVVLIFAEEGFNWYLPDDPTGYKLLNPDLPS